MAETERELLEKAARAAGIVIAPQGHARFVGTHESLYFFSEHRNHPLCKGREGPGNVEWNPLEDDGDALRLAVAISMKSNDGIKIMLPDMHDPWAVVRSFSNATAGRAEDADPYAATRRAIVRAAAAMGES